jgi:hypothetical protein
MVGTQQRSITGTVGRAVVAGIAGTAVMTAFQKFIEMPLTGRENSYAPAEFAQRILPVRAKSDQARERLNYVTHFALGGMWGIAFGVAAVRGLRGQKAVNTVFATVYTGDVVLNTALGLYKPTQWSMQDVVVDVVDKYVQAQATGYLFERFLDPARS